MNPQNSSQDPDQWPAEPNHAPEPTQQSSTFPKPADAWPPQAAASGDVEPMTAPTVDSRTTLETDDKIRQATPADQSGEGVTHPKPRGLWRVVVIAALAMLLIGGGGAAAYAWYENSDRVMADSLAQLVTAKTLNFNGTGDLSSGSTKLSLAYNGASSQQELSLHGKLTAGAGSSSLTAEGDVVSDKGGNYYFKIANVKDILASFLTSVPAAEKPSVDQMIAKVDNKWIKIPATSGASTNNTAPALQQCFRTAFSKVQTDAAYRNELTKLYGDHRFIVVKKNLGLSGMSVGYRLAIDPTKERAFIDNMPHTKLYGDLKKCDSGLDLTSLKLDTNAASLPEFELWANALTHQPKRMTIMNPPSQTATTYALTVNPVLNPSVTITVPKDATDIQQLQTELLSLSMAAYGGMQQSLNDTVKSRTDAMTLQKKMEAYDAENGTYPTFTQIMAATGVAELTPDMKAIIIPSSPPARGQLSLVPCKDTTKGGVISYLDASTGTIKTLTYGSC